MNAKFQAERMNVIANRLESFSATGRWESILRRNVPSICIQRVNRSFGISFRGGIGHKPFHVNGHVLPTQWFQMFGEPLRVSLELLFVDRRAVAVPAVPAHRRRFGQYLGVFCFLRGDLHIFISDRNLNEQRGRNHGNHQLQPRFTVHHFSPTFAGNSYVSKKTVSRSPCSRMSHKNSPGSSDGAASKVARRSAGTNSSTGSRTFAPSDEKYIRVSRWRCNPRIKITTAKCGACTVPSGW